MKKLRLFLIFLMIIFLFTNFTNAITSEEIIKQVDEYRHLKSAKMEATMTIIKGDRRLTKEMTSWVKGSSQSLTEFTNPRDRGTKFLKRGDNLWMFFADAEDIVKISGHMLNQGMMGSDYSYQDLMESTKLEELYEFKIKGEENINSRSCYVLEGIKHKGKEASYYRRVSWIDKERFVLLKEQLYAQSGRLLKEMETQEVKQIEGRWFATKSIMEDKLQRNTRTEFEINSIEFNANMPDDTFSLRRLRN